ncbi:nucleoid occlusion factor SlmA [Paraburkholderia rhizosphaerae]|uniref:TetR family transcriptional regulator n=1 Tax=Paraburkholderia rhizosphaerae TaxID=480658 RepID=A0A4R8LQK3_9BURK|nr:nucleoid occlusion factor SlmA [Paraburkholderia rhizosphaerae]TDY49839.1 TetR family transcriptional regulator [Paraburkholderia rhizosphaerae]
MQPIRKHDEAVTEDQPDQPGEPHSAADTNGNGARATRLKPGERRVHILQTLAAMLEAPKNEKITTAALAARLGVSEAALYRHFASKAQMFEGLIEFIEQTLFGLINQIVTKEPNGVLQARAIALTLLNFSAKNPGMTRVLTCEALVGEHERLTERVNQILERIETSLKQCLRVGIMEANGQNGNLANAVPAASAVRVGDDDDAADGQDAAPNRPTASPGTGTDDIAVPLPAGYDPAVRANLLLSYIIGRWHRYVRSGFARAPGEHADAQLLLILQ